MRCLDLLKIYVSIVIDLLESKQSYKELEPIPNLKRKGCFSPTNLWTKEKYNKILKYNFFSF